MRSATGARSNVRRGRVLEEMLTPSFAACPRCLVEHTSPPVHVQKFTKRNIGGGGQFLGNFEAKGMCDYEGPYRDRAVCIDAKRTGLPHSRRYNLIGACKDHQVTRLTMTHTLGNCAGLIVMWDAETPLRSDEWFGVAWWRVLDWHAEGFKTIALHELRDAARHDRSGIVSLQFYHGLIRGRLGLNVEPFLEHLYDVAGG